MPGGVKKTYMRVVEQMKLGDSSCGNASHCRTRGGTRARCGFVESLLFELSGEHGEGAATGRVAAPGVSPAVAGRIRLQGAGTRNTSPRPAINFRALRVVHLRATPKALGTRRSWPSIKSPGEAQPRATFCGARRVLAGGLCCAPARGNWGARRGILRSPFSC